MFDHLPLILAALGEDPGGWMRLAFSESPLAALAGPTPRQVLEQGDVDRVEKLAAVLAAKDR